MVWWKSKILESVNNEWDLFGHSLLQCIVCESGLNMLLDIVFHSSIEIAPTAWSKCV